MHISKAQFIKIKIKYIKISNREMIAFEYMDIIKNHRVILLMFLLKLLIKIHLIIN